MHHRAIAECKECISGGLCEWITCAPYSGSGWWTKTARFFPDKKKKTAGRGGDCHHWIGHRTIRFVDVVDTDTTALEEYARRLVVSYKAAGVGGGVYLLPGGCRIALHHHDALCLPDAVGQHADLALLDFSVSQIVGGWMDVGRLLFSLCVDRSIASVCIVAHDHAYAGVPPPGCGVAYRVIQALPCRSSPGWCCCEDDSVYHGATRLEMNVLGSSMAMSIGEFAFDGEAFVTEVHRLVRERELPERLTVAMFRPFLGSAEEVHWLLRSLVFIRVTVA